MTKVKQLVRKYQTVSQKVIVKLHEKTLEVKSNELKNTKEELQLAKSINLTLSKRIQELEMAGNEVSNQRGIIESVDNEEVLEKCDQLEPLKCSQKGNAEEKKSVNKCKRKQSLQENENEFEESKRQCTKLTCDSCKKRYANSQSLQRHISSVHEGLKPFSCQSCDSKFANNQTLKNHIAGVHEGKKPFKCQTCDCNFANNKSLKRHISAIHEGQKPFKCHSCEYTCALKHNLDVHVNAVHDKHMINCSKCNRKFTCKDLKKKHEPNCKGTQL